MKHSYFQQMAKKFRTVNGNCCVPQMWQGKKSNSRVQLSTMLGWNVWGGGVGQGGVGWRCNYVAIFNFVEYVSGAYTLWKGPQCLLNMRIFRVRC